MGLLDARREGRNGPTERGRRSEALASRLRLFGLLALLVPLFAGLQLIARESEPRVEVQTVTVEAPPAVPIVVVADAPVEKVVEHVVYVPVERRDAAPQAEPVTSDVHERVPAIA